LTLLGLDRFELLHMKPGLLMDLWYLYRLQHNMIKNDPSLTGAGEEEEP
jgi:hypothetical protein